MNTNESPGAPAQNQVDQYKQSYGHLAFIHQKLLTTQFYPEEFSSADSALKFITAMANELAQKIDELTPKESVNVETN
jgi:hypothetical protein